MTGRYKIQQSASMRRQAAMQSLVQRGIAYKFYRSPKEQWSLIHPLEIEKAPGVFLLPPIEEIQT
jgi:hypothetical protein